VQKYFDFIVIGGGAAGLTAAITANGFGKSVLMIEKNKLGGECTWSGCVPSKSLIKSAHVINEYKNAKNYGVAMPKGNVDIDQVFENIKEIQKHIYAHEDPKALSKLGIKVVSGFAKFKSKTIVECNGVEYRGKRIMLAMGSVPNVPPIDGADEIPYLTNESLFNQDEIPESIGIIGSGPIGLEMAQSFARLGARIEMISITDRVLMIEDQEITDILEEKLKKEGINIHYVKGIESLRKSGDKVHIKCIGDGKYCNVDVDKILMATGRKVNFDGMRLDAAGVQYDQRGILVNSFLGTTASGIYACGDCVGPYKLSHMAEYQGITATVNALLPLKKKVQYGNLIWCIFTDPELAHLGITEEQARKDYGNSIDVIKVNYSEVDRAQTERKPDGMLKVILNNRGKILGAVIIGERAGELIHQLQIFKTLNIPLHKGKDIIVAYPTYSDIIKKAIRQAYLLKLSRNPLIKILKKK